MKKFFGYSILIGIFVVLFVVTAVSTNLFVATVFYILCFAFVALVHLAVWLINS